MRPALLLRRSWREAWAKLGARPPTGLFGRLVDRYREPHRRYHTLQHLIECIEHLEPARGLAERPGEVEAALWFHDAIYEPGLDDNEMRSAEWAREELESAGVSLDACLRVHALVLATRHDAPPDTADESLLADVDLAILGAEPARFDEYERQVREEHRAVADDAFHAARSALLATFLQREGLYRTSRFRRSHEAQARANLRRSIGRSLEALDRTAASPSTTGRDCR